LITVKFHTALKKYCPNDEGLLEIKYAEGLTVKSLLQCFNLDNGAVGLVLVNGKFAGNNCELASGDNVDLYPIFAGG